MEQTIKKLKKLLDDQSKSNQTLRNKLRLAEQKIKDLEHIVNAINQGHSVKREKRAEKDDL